MMAVILAVIGSHPMQMLQRFVETKAASLVTIETH